MSSNKKSKAVKLLLTTFANELRLTCVLSRTKVILLITSSRVNVKILTVFSIYRIPTLGSDALIIHINSESDSPR